VSSAMRSVAFFFGLLIIATMTTHRWRGTEPAESLVPPTEPVPSSLFGLHIHHLNTPTPWPAVPFGAWRLWDAYAVWPNVEPQKGRWDFSWLDNDVSEAERHHVEILLPLGLSPGWASSRPGEKSGYSPGNAAEPRDLSDWQEYVRQVATRYKGRIHAYEIWNEPNLSEFFSGRPEQMLELARTAYGVLKKVDNTIIVVSPSATSQSGIAWLDDYLKLGGGAYADVIGFHLYVTPEAPEKMLELGHRLRTVVQENHLDGKPLWNTEAGWLITNRLSEVRPRSSSFSKVLTLEEASAYVARCYVLNWAMGISRFYFYSWDSEVGGLTEADGRTLKPPATAYAEIENWLVGARMLSCLADQNDTWSCELSRPGYRGWVVWNPRRTMKFRIPESWPVSRRKNLSGERLPLGSDPLISIGPTPILLESEPPEGPGPQTGAGRRTQRPSAGRSVSLGELVRCSMERPGGKTSVGF
jgi:Glycosyl hydrolases family 39